MRCAPARRAASSALRLELDLVGRGGRDAGRPARLPRRRRRASRAGRDRRPRSRRRGCGCAEARGGVADEGAHGNARGRELPDDLAARPFPWRLSRGSRCLPLSSRMRVNCLPGIIAHPRRRPVRGRAGPSRSSAGPRGRGAPRRRPASGNSRPMRSFSRPSRDPAEDLAGARDELLARRDVVDERRPRQEEGASLREHLQDRTARRGRSTARRAPSVPRGARHASPFSNVVLPTES